MLRHVFVIAILLTIARTASAQKQSMLESIQKREAATWDMALKIWDLAEPGYQEFGSSKLLADSLEQAGFRVERGVAEIPTAFTATYGQGSPVIGIMGEYDALPGLSQEAVAERMPRERNNYGHGCGHHLFGAASASAAIAVAEQIKAGQLKGTVRFYGCPAEEGGSGKAFMVRARIAMPLCIGIRPPETRQAIRRAWPVWQPSFDFTVKVPTPQAHPN